MAWETFVSYLVDHGDVIVSVLTLLGLAAAGFATNQRRERREFTQRLMGLSLEEQHLAHADYLIHQFMLSWRTEEGIQPERCPTVDMPDDLQEAIRMTLNYYQQIAASYREGILDREFVMTVRGVYMRRLFLFFEDYICRVRRDLDRPELYGELETLAKGDAAAYEARLFKRIGKASPAA